MPTFWQQYRHTLSPADEVVIYISAHALHRKQMPVPDPQSIASAFDHPRLKVIMQPGDLHQYFQQLKRSQLTLLLMSSGNFDQYPVHTLWNSTT